MTFLIRFHGSLRTRLFASCSQNPLDAEHLEHLQLLPVVQERQSKEHCLRHDWMLASFFGSSGKDMLFDGLRQGRLSITTENDF
jgi:hypothetical protein